MARRFLVASTALAATLFYSSTAFAQTAATAQTDPQTGDPSPTEDSGRADSQTAGTRPGLDDTGDIIIRMIAARELGTFGSAARTKGTASDEATSS